MADVQVERLRAAVSTSGTAKSAKDLTIIKRNLDEVAEDRQATIKVKVEDREVKPAIRRAKELGENRTGRIRVKVHDGEVTRATAKAEALDTKLVGIQGFGAKVRGLKFGGQGLTMALGIPAALSAIGPLVGGINSLAAGAVGLVAPLSKMSNLVATLPGLLAPAAAGFAGVKLATMGVGDAIGETVKLQEELAKAMTLGDEDAITDAKEKIDQLAASMEGKFHPTALSFIADASMMKVEMDELGKVLQPSFFRGANSALHDFDEMLASITPRLGQVTAGIGDMLAGIGRELNSDKFLGNIDEALSGSTLAVSAMTDAVTGLLDAFGTLGAKSQPVLERVYGTLQRLTAQVQLYADGLTDSKLQEGYDSFQDLWRVLRNVWDALVGTMRAFQPMGDQLLDHFGRLSAKWNAWTQSIEGQNTLAQWAEDSMPVLEELGRFLADFSKMWARISDEGRMAEVIETLRVKFIPALEAVASSSAATDTLNKLAGAIGNVLTIISTTLGTSGVMGLFLDLVIDITNLIADLINQFDFLGVSIANFATSLGLLKILGVKGPIGLGLSFILTTVISLTGSLKPLVPIVYGFAAAWAAVKLTSVYAQLTNIVSVIQNMASIKGVGFFTAFSGSLKASAGQAGGLSSILGGAVHPAILAVTAAVMAGVMVWQAWHTNVRRVEEEMAQFTDTINDGTPALEGLRDSFDNILDTRDSFDESFQKSPFSKDFIVELVDRHGAAIDDARGKWHEYGESFDRVMGNARTGTSQFTDALGDMNADVRDFYLSLQEAQAQGLMDQTEVEEVIDAVTDLGKQQKAANIHLGRQADRFKEAASAGGDYALVEEQLNRFYASSSLEERQAILQELGAIYPWIADQADLSIDSTERLNEMFERQAEVVDAAKRELDEYYGSVAKVAGEKDLIKAQDDLVGKMDDLWDRLKEGKGEWSNATEAGRDHRDVLRELYDSYLGQADAIIKSGGSAKDARGKYFEFVGEIQRMADAGLLGKESINGILEELKLTSRSWEADFALVVREEGMLKLQAIEQLLKTLPTQGEAYQIAVDAVVAGDIEKVDRIRTITKFLADNPRAEATWEVTGSFDQMTQALIGMTGAARADGGLTKGEILFQIALEAQGRFPDNFPSMEAYLEHIWGSTTFGVPVKPKPEKQYLEPGDIGFTGPIPIPAVPEIDISSLQPGQTGIPLFDDIYKIPAELNVTAPSQEELDGQMSGRRVNARLQLDTSDANDQVNGWTPPIPDEKLKPRVSFDHANRVVNAWRIPIPDNKLKPRVDFTKANEMIREWEPPKVTLELRATGLAEAIREQIDGLPKYTINIEGKVTPTPNANGGIYGGYDFFSNAAGALPGQAKIQQPRQRLIQWAEPETHGEAFIPLAPSKRSRSLAIWAKTGQLLGAMAEGGINNKVFAKLNPNFDEMKWPGGDPAFLGGDGAVWQRLVSFLASTGIPHRVTSTVRPGATTRASGRQSYHAVGRAVDFAGPSGGRSTPELLAIYRAFLPIRSMLKELIYSGPGGSNPRNPITRADHYDHVHVAMADGGFTGVVGKALWTINRIMERSESLYLRRPKYDALLDRATMGGWGVREFEDYSARVIVPGGRLLKVVNADWEKERDQRTAKLREQRAQYGAEFADNIMIHPFAKGGIVTRPTVGLIGEAGPEAVIPLADGGVTAPKLSTYEQLRVFSGGEVNSMLDGLKKIMTATGAWTKFVADVNRSDPAKAVKKIATNWNQAYTYLNAVHKRPVPKAVNGGFSSEHLWAQLAEAFSNEWQDHISRLSESDPHKAIREIQTRMFQSGVKKWSNEWVSMTNQIQAIQTRLAEEQARKAQNRWEWEFERAEPQRQVIMAKQAASTMEKWSDEWVAMMRRVEEAERRNTGPAVIINEAIFNDEADIDAFNRGIEWAVRTSRL